jgi:hypothetical protein
MPTANTAGQVTLTIPRLGRVKNVRLRFANSANTTFALSSITQVQMKLGGGIQRRATASRWDAINALNGAAYASQAYGTSATDYERFLTLYCEEPWRNRIRANSIDPAALGWKTLWTGSNKPLQIILDVAALGAGVQAAISAEVEFDDNDDGKENAIIKWESDDYNTNSGIASIANIDNGLKAGEGIVQISAFTTPSGSTPTQVRFEWGKSVIKNDQLIRSLNNELISYGMAPATADAIVAAAHIVLDKNDALDDALAVGVASSLLKVTLSATTATTLPIVKQVLGLPNKS